MTMTKKGNIRKYDVILARTKAVTYISQINVQLSFLIINSLLSATSILSRSPTAYNTTEFLDKLACTDYVDFGKCQDRFGRTFWSKIDSNCLDFKLRLFKREDKNAEFHLRQNFSMGEADFNQFIRQRNQLVVASDNFLREQNLSPVLQSTLSKDMEEQLKLVHKVIDVVDYPNRRICVTLLRYKADNPDNSYAQFRLFGRKKEEEKFQQSVYVNYKLDEFVYLLDVKNSVYDKVTANQPISNVLFLQLFTTFIYSFYSSQDQLGHWR